MNPLILIPARMAATRLPNKPLADIGGRPMIVRAWAQAAASGEPAAFSRARRAFYRRLLLIGGNRELQRLFPAIGMHVIHAQYPSPRLQGIRLADYQAIARAVAAGDAEAAESAAIAHVANVRTVIVDLASAM